MLVAFRLLPSIAAPLVFAFAAAAAHAATLTGEIRDAATGQLVAARLYIRSSQGQWYFARSADRAGRAVEYRKERGPVSVEMHTALSAHPFTVDLPPGRYQLTVERGKEYWPAEREVEVGDSAVKVAIEIRRWINMADRGWYSGDTHVHRSLDELPTAMLAEDLNVAFPLTYWVTKSDTPPSQGDKNQPAVEPKLIEVTPQHVIWPLNTEYEIFTVGQRRHTLGAVFGLGHRSVLARGVPPVKPIADQVHREGGLLDLDKHNWPWSMMLIPVMQVDLFELANNHHWRTEFAFRTFGEPIPDYMQLPRSPAGMDEKAWTEFGFQNYYALLNCGFRLMPTAGTASGVHPVPLGFSRVYVDCQRGFSYDDWLAGLAAGRSFVTTGPMMFVEVDGAPQANYQQGASERTYTIQVQAWSPSSLRLELLQEGRVIAHAANSDPPPNSRVLPLTLGSQVRVASSTWLAARCFRTLPGGRLLFAHCAPIFIDVENKPLRPKRAEAEYLISRVQAEIERNTGVLPAEALAEFREALAKYQAIAERAE
jgi:hypothetical protein